jgi:hypothetical protein
MVPQRDTTYPSFRRRRTELMSHLWRDLCQGNGCVDRRLHGRQIAGFTFLVLVDGWMWEEIYALEWCNVVVVVMRTQCVAATTRGKICVETREGKDEMYADDGAEKEHSHKGHETTFEPLFAVLKGEPEVDDIPEEVRLS